MQEAQELMDKCIELNKSGQYAAAIPLAQRAVAIRERELGSEHPDTAQSLHTLGVLYIQNGDYTQAELVFQRAIAIREKVLGPESPETAYSVHNLALVYVEIGEYAKAEPLYQRALSIAEKVLGDAHPFTARSLNNLGSLYRQTGAYAKAEPLLQRSLSLSEKLLGPEHADTALPLNALAILYKQTGAYAKAESLYQRALAIREKELGPAHPDTASSIHNLALLYFDTGAIAKAEPLMQRALAIWEKTPGPEHPLTAYALNDLADLYLHTGAYAKAEPLVQRALAIREKVLGVDHPQTALSLSNLANLYFATGAYAKADPLYRRALSIREKALGFDHPDTVDSLNGLAELNWAEGELAGAQTLFERVELIQVKNSERFLLNGSEARKLAYLQLLAKSTYRIVSFSVSVPEPKNIKLGLTSVLQSKGRVLDAVADSMAHLRQSVRAQDQALFERLAELANRLSILTYRGPGQMSVDNFRQLVQDLTAQQEKLEGELSKRSNEFRRQIAPVTLAAVSAAIPKDAVLVEWFRYVPVDPKQNAEKTQPINARYVAYVVKRNSDPVVIDIGEAQPIDALTREFRNALSDARHADIKVTSAALSEKLLKPLRNYLKGHERILMSPDGALNLLPLAALLDEHGDFLAQHYEVTYLTSARDLLHLSQTSNSHREAVVMADPDFGASTRSIAQANSLDSSLRSADLDRSGLLFRPLNNTALEAQELKTILKLKDSEVLLQTNATESSLKQVHGPRILHVATHGFFLNDQELEEEMKKRGGKDFMASVGENPLLRSGIALAGANARRSGANDDGVLTALEAAQLDLRGTELVVLSACDTGVGEVQNGEGVYGLRRALVLAGAQTQVTSLWKVSDEATRILMVEFYQRLLKGEGRSAALRHAQLHMLAIPEYSHPYYWASFIPIGNWTPLPSVH